MGNTLPTQAKVTIDKNKLDLCVKQIYFTAQLQKDRKKGLQSVKEKELAQIIKNPKNTRNASDEFSKASSLANTAKSIKALEYIMLYADILKDNKTVIQLSNGDTKKIEDLVPYVESLIWGSRQCNIECIKQFEDVILATFGPEFYEQITQFSRVTSELKILFNSLLPTDKETKLYIVDFCSRNGLGLEIMNEVGHDIIPSELNDDPEPKDQSPKNPPPSDGGNYGGNEPINQDRYPQFDPMSFQQPPNQNMQYGGYPNFQRLENQPYPQGGFGSEFDAKLQNIKKGL